MRDIGFSFNGESAHLVAAVSRSGLKTCLKKVPVNNVPSWQSNMFTVHKFHVIGVVH